MRKNFMFAIIGVFNNYALGAFINWDLAWMNYIPTTDMAHRVLYLVGLVSSICLSVIIGNFFTIED